MKKIIKYIVICLIFILLFIFLNILVQPKYKEDLVEGSFISDYYKSNFDHEVIIIGDCEVYANFSPLEMYQQDGIKAYVRGNSQQMLWQSYYVLKETLKYEHPKLVVLSVGAMRNGSDMINEAYNRLALDKMKWSKEKMEMIKASMSDEENFLDYVFPILRYHSRIGDLTKEDFAYLFKDKKVTYNGFLINKEVKGLENLPTKRRLSNYEFPPENMDYLNKIIDLCKEEDIDLLLMKAPSLYPYWYDEQDEIIKNIALDKDVDYINLVNYIDEIGLDFDYDTYDGGLHLNLNGAIKNSKFFSTYLKEHYELKDFRDDEAYLRMLKEYNKEKE